MYNVKYNTKQGGYIMVKWNSNQYLKFKNERTQPSIDLVNRISVLNPKKILDMGCGPGNSTQVLKERFPNAHILGVDNSKEMIETAKNELPDLDFDICDASKDLSKLSGEFDIVFSNACIQWVPDHPKLIKEMFQLLKKGGELAVQIPMNYNEPIHKIIGEVSENEKWRSYFDNPRIFYTLSQSEYFDLLSEVTHDFCVWETVYCHRLKSHEAIMEWYRGTGLRPYLSVLSEEKKKEFEKDIFDRLVQEYKAQKNGEIIFRFPRFFFIAIK